MRWSPRQHKAREAEVISRWGMRESGRFDEFEKVSVTGNRVVCFAWAGDQDDASSVIDLVR